MKIALINENSQAAKNSLIEETLKKVVEPMGHEVVNYGMYSAEDEAQLTYVQCGILAAILLNSGAADFVVTGCGTGEGALGKAAAGRGGCSFSAAALSYSGPGNATPRLTPREMETCTQMLTQRPLCTQEVEMRQISVDR